MTPEEIADIFRDMEDYLASSMKRNLSSHKAQELTEGFEWKQWQAMQLRSLNEYRYGLGPAVNAYFDKANPEIEAMIRDQFKEAAGAADRIYKGVGPGNGITSGGDNFFEINKPRVNQLVDEALNGVNGLRYAVINKAGTDYTSIIQRADFLYQTGAMTLDQSVDMASKSFLEKGLSCVVYANGATVGIASYVEMALRTSSRKTVMTAEGAKRAEWGEFLVVVPSIGSTCPLCMAWQAMILVDDVYAGGRPDGVHGLLSTAMEAGLLHPNCRHKPSTYFEGISTVPTESPEARTAKQYAAEQRQRVIERNIRKYKRLEAGSLDSSNVTKYAAKKNEWQAEMRKHLDENPELRRKPSREKSYGPGTTPPTTPTTSPVVPPVVSIKDEFTNKVNSLEGMSITGRPVESTVANPSRMAKNPIPYVGEAMDDDITNVIRGKNIDLRTSGTFGQVDIDSLKSGQLVVERKKVIDLLGVDPSTMKDARGGLDEIIVYKRNGKNVLWDGNHRVAMAKLSGHITINARVIDLDVMFPPVQAPKPTLLQKIEHIKGGRTTMDLETTKRIGAAVREDFMPKIAEHKATGMVLTSRREEIKAEMNANYAVNKARYFNGEITLDQLNDATLADSKEYDELTRKIFQNNMDMSKVQRNAILESLGKIRPMGDPKFADNQHFSITPAKKASNVTLKETVQEASNCYPTEWLEKSNNKGELLFSELKKVGDITGSYNGVEIKLLDVTDKGLVVHEMGHRMEDVLSTRVSIEDAIDIMDDVTYDWSISIDELAWVRGLKKLEADFYNSRTVGESYGPLTGYSCQGKNDRFKDRYAGRTPYADDSYEIFSTGVNNLLYPGRVNLIDDTEFMDFILGILGGL